MAKSIQIKPEFKNKRKNSVCNKENINLRNKQHARSGSECKLATDKTKSQSKTKAHLRSNSV